MTWQKVPGQLAVRPDPDGEGWIVHHPGAEDKVTEFDTQEEALFHAEEIAREEGLSIILYDEDGQINDTIEFLNEVDED